MIDVHVSRQLGGYGQGRANHKSMIILYIHANTLLTQKNEKHKKRGKNTIEVKSKITWQPGYGSAVRSSS